jgi:hypothetical protein
LLVALVVFLGARIGVTHLQVEVLGHRLADLQAATVGALVHDEAGVGLEGVDAGLDVPGGVDVRALRHCGGRAEQRCGYCNIFNFIHK